MGESLTTVIVIVLVAGIFFVFPLMQTANQADTTSQLAVQTAITEFTNQTALTRQITEDDYQKLVSEVSSTGHKFNIDMKATKLDTTYSKKTTQVSSSKIGENPTYEEFASQILEAIKNTGQYTFNPGDSISVDVYNEDTTIGQQLGKLFGGNDDTSAIVASSSSMIH